MQRIRFRLAALAIVSAVGLAACADDATPVESSRASAVLPSEVEFVRQVPGFGGFFVDQDGAPTVYLLPGSSRAPAERLVGGPVRVLEANYDWLQLDAWKETATFHAFPVDGTVFVDNDETLNRVTIGVADRGAIDTVRSAVAAAGIPEEAVVIVEAQPIYRVATLQNVVDRPVRAGVQINFPGFLCSVGFNANSGTQRSMITASHCTSHQGGEEGTPYWQPLESVDGTQIATEVDDPDYVKNGPGCPRGKTCRKSDAARAVYVDGANQALGVIAATSGANNGSLTITGSLSITSDDTNNGVAVGASVDKVGRTTGWTSGPVTNKCVNTGVQGSRIVQLCQNFVSAGVGGGDSGSDVFAVTSGSNVRLEGVLWGGNGAGDQFVYSPLENVIAELGPLTTH